MIHSISTNSELPGNCTVNDITEELADGVRSWLHGLLEIGRTHAIMTIDSNGGDVYALLSMLDAIASAQQSGLTLVTFGTGKCFSSAVTLLASGTPGYRYASPLLRLMDHPVATTSNGGPEDQVVSQTKELVRVGRICNRKLEQFTHCEPGFFLEKIKLGGSEWYFDAKAAKKCGIVDKIAVPRIVNKLVVK
jgi:ATP-dependent protease ClpP protease subunit